MARVKPKQLYIKDFQHFWDNIYKPEILKYHQIPIELVAEVFGTSVGTIQDQLRSGLYDYGVARPCKGGQFSYEVYPLRLIAFVEGTLPKANFISHGNSD